jgi:large subunit ribosomal protein L25
VGPRPRSADQIVEERSVVSEVKLTAEARSEFGKGAARRLRRESKVPAVLYGHGTDPLHITLPGHATMMALKHSNALLTLELGGGRIELALPKDVQRNATKDHIEHVDLLLVKRGEKVTVDVPIHFTGDPISGTMVTHDLTTLQIEVEATAIPESITVDMTGLDAGARILAGDVALPAGAAFTGDPEAIVVQVTGATAMEDDTGEAGDEATVGGEGAGGAADAAE